MRIIISTIFSLLVALASVTSAFAAEPVNTLDKSGLLSGYKATGIAIRGYDTVAYFTQGKPVEGSEEFSLEWNGATWQFAVPGRIPMAYCLEAFLLSPRVCPSCSNKVG
ncbi:MAG: hypothetical protein KTR18_08055 [Acidiferrobacterales bacterium]|nr:hypothetical protein [Acidiferrobacterales bacterium]